MSIKLTEDEIRKPLVFSRIPDNGVTMLGIKGLLDTQLKNVIAELEEYDCFDIPAHRLRDNFIRAIKSEIEKG